MKPAVDHILETPMSGFSGHPVQRRECPEKIMGSLRDLDYQRGCAA